MSLGDTIAGPIPVLSTAGISLEKFSRSTKLAPRVLKWLWEKHEKTEKLLGLPPEVMPENVRRLLRACPDCQKERHCAFFQGLAGGGESESDEDDSAYITSGLGSDDSGPSDVEGETKANKKKREKKSKGEKQEKKSKGRERKEKGEQQEKKRARKEEGEKQEKKSKDHGKNEEGTAPKKKARRKSESTATPKAGGSTRAAEKGGAKPKDGGSKERSWGNPRMVALQA